MSTIDCLGQQKSSDFMCSFVHRIKIGWFLWTNPLCMSPLLFIQSYSEMSTSVQFRSSIKERIFGCSVVCRLLLHCLKIVGRLVNSN
uniref:Uncharacterized protein n=1 Tax=Pyxicephalus adspersus TaxID=30357 RepID=A0AAV3A9Y1_PYXAD|nr:TPA: hypothetical protein GDO54_015697 [Pyxicephalus adspersus]